MSKENYKYTEDHEWLDINDGKAKLGITDFAQGELGDIVFVELPNTNDAFNQNDIFGTIEAVKTLADLYIPISGTVVEINDKLEGEPELINSDPYGEGWIVKIELSDQSEVDQLLTEVDYKGLIN